MKVAYDFLETLIGNDELGDTSTPFHTDLFFHIHLFFLSNAKRTDTLTGIQSD